MMSGACSEFRIRVCIKRNMSLGFILLPYHNNMSFEFTSCTLVALVTLSRCTRIFDARDALNKATSNKQCAKKMGKEATTELSNHLESAVILVSWDSFQSEAGLAKKQFFKFNHQYCIFIITITVTFIN